MKLEIDLKNSTKGHVASDSRVFLRNEVKISCLLESLKK